MDFLEHQKFQKRLKAFLDKECFNWTQFNLGRCDSGDYYSISFEEVK